MPVETPNPPYYAVIFTSVLSDDLNGYTEMNEKVMEIAHQQDGFLGQDAARNEIGIAVGEHTCKDGKDLNIWVFEKNSFICGFEHGYSLKDGTH